LLISLLIIPHRILSLLLIPHRLLSLLIIPLRILSSLIIPLRILSLLVIPLHIHYSCSYEGAYAKPVDGEQQEPLRPVFFFSSSLLSSQVLEGP